MKPIEIFALSYFGRFSIEELERIISRFDSIEEILKADFMDGFERFKAHYDEKFMNDQERRAK
ncbi:MAG TPA: DNA-protecting protein DprA, partial [Pseudothermotoga sp.]